MSANKFVLKGPGVETDYSIGANPSSHALVYKSGTTITTLKPARIETDGTGFGRTVSVPLKLTTDTGGERIVAFLPIIDTPQG